MPDPKDNAAVTARDGNAASVPAREETTAKCGMSTPDGVGGFGLCGFPPNHEGHHYPHHKPAPTPLSSHDGEGREPLKGYSCWMGNPARFTSVNVEKLYHCGDPDCPCRVNAPTPEYAARAASHDGEAGETPAESFKRLARKVGFGAETATPSSVAEQPDPYFGTIDDARKVVDGLVAELPSSVAGARSEEEGELAEPSEGPSRE